MSVNTLQLDAENPWPGLESFDEASAAFFHGRNAETEELRLALMRAPLTVLYGQSGLGKTSLLRAGLFPLLRDADFLPVYIRLDHGETSPPLLEQVWQNLLASAAEARAELPAPEADESLWAYFHRQDLEIWSRGYRPLTPVLVFDQFEELFTLGGQVSAPNGKIPSFLAALACLSENRVPADLARMLEADPALARRFDFRKQDYKLLLAFREDFLPEVEELRRRMPSIAQNRMRLLPLARSQALEAVEKSGGALLTRAVAQGIVRFVAAAQQSREQEDGEATDTQPAIETPVEPALLSLVCAGLNNHRKQRGLALISAELLDSCQDGIIETFYAQSLAGQDPAVRVFIEDELLTRAGHRDSRALDDMLMVPGISEEAIDQLVRHRLLRIEERYGQKRLELTHDRLTATVKASRDGRWAEEARKSAELVAKRRRKRLIGWSVTGIVLVLLLAGFAGYSYVQWQRAEAQTRRAEQRKQALLAVINRLTYEVPERLLQRPGNAELARKIFEDNVALLEDLLHQEGETQDVLREKSVNFTSMGDLWVLFGDLDRALHAYRSGLAIDERLVAQDADNSERQRDLSISHKKIGDVLSVQRDLAGALREYRAGLAIDERLVAQDSGNSQWQRGLSISHERIGDVLSIQGVWDGALREYLACQEIVKRLNTLDNSNSELQRGLSLSHEKIGDVLAEQGDLAGALLEYRADLEIAVRLAKQNPGNSQWQRDLSVGHERIGNMLSAQDDPAGALREYRASLEIRERLSAQDTSNAQWQRDLSVSHDSIGNVLSARGDLAGALRAYRASLDIRERLALRDASNSQWQRDLAVGYLNLGSVFEKQKKHVDARDYYQKSRQIMAHLRVQSPDWAVLDKDLAWLNERLAKLK